MKEFTLNFTHDLGLFPAESLDPLEYADLPEAVSVRIQLPFDWELEKFEENLGSFVRKPDGIGKLSVYGSCYPCRDPDSGEKLNCPTPVAVVEALQFVYTDGSVRAEQLASGHVLGTMQRKAGFLFSKSAEWIWEIHVPQIPGIVFLLRFTYT